MQSKQSEDRPAGVANNTPIRVGSRVFEKGNERERGTVIRLGTQANGWVGYAWIKFDHSPGKWVDLTLLEGVGMPSSAEHPVPEANTMNKRSNHR